MKVRINKNYVLRKISEKLNELGDWKYFDVLVFAHQQSLTAEKPESYEELVELLKDYDSVYQFNEVETNLHGAVAYDIILNEKMVREG